MPFHYSVSKVPPLFSTRDRFPGRLESGGGWKGELRGRSSGELLAHWLWKGRQGGDRKQNLGEVCSLLVPNRPRPPTSPWPWGRGPLFYIVSFNNLCLLIG